MNFATQEYLYSRAVRTEFLNSATGDQLEREIPFPGLAGSKRQLAVPIVYGERLHTLFHVASSEEQRFTYEDEDALMVLAPQLALSIERLSHVLEPLQSLPPRRLQALCSRASRSWSSTSRRTTASFLTTTA